MKYLEWMLANCLDSASRCEGTYANSCSVRVTVKVSLPQVAKEEEATKTGLKTGTVTTAVCCMVTNLVVVDDVVDRTSDFFPVTDPICSDLLKSVSCIKILLEVDQTCDSERTTVSTASATEVAVAITEVCSIGVPDIEAPMFAADEVATTSEVTEAGSRVLKLLLVAQCCCRWGYLPQEGIDAEMNNRKDSAWRGDVARGRRLLHGDGRLGRNLDGRNVNVVSGGSWQSGLLNDNRGSSAKDSNGGRKFGQEDIASGSSPVVELDANIVVEFS